MIYQEGFYKVVLKRIIMLLHKKHLIQRPNFIILKMSSLTLMTWMHIKYRVYVTRNAFQLQQNDEGKKDSDILL